MRFEEHVLGDLIVNFDKRRIPLSSRQRSLRKGIYPYYGATSIMDYVDDYIFEGQYILMGEDGTVLDENGHPILQKVEGKFWCNNHAHVIRNTELITFNYLYYLLKNTNVRPIVTGAVQPKISQSNMNNLRITIHKNIHEQRKVASILTVLDDRIANNTAINKNLEEQAQAIFADFLASHQTSSVTVEDVVLTANTGADAIRKTPIVDYDTGVRCVRVGDLSNQRPVYEWGFTQVTPEIFTQYQLHKDDIVITRTASLGLNRLISEDLNAVYNNGLIRITVNQNMVYSLILFRQFQTANYRNYISRINSETSVRPNMKINYLMKYKFDIPHISEQAKLIEILQPIFVAQENNVAENQALSTLRDTLLPKLMSGEIDVSNIEI